MFCGWEFNSILLLHIFFFVTYDIAEVGFTEIVQAPVRGQPVVAPAPSPVVAAPVPSPVSTSQGGEPGMLFLHVEHSFVHLIYNFPIALITKRLSPLDPLYSNK